MREINKKKLLKKILKNNKGSMYIFAFVLTFVLLTMTGIVIEIYRIHSIQAHVEYELQRAVNISIEEAMRDTFRIDKVNKLDIQRAKNNFYKYIYNDLGVNASKEKVIDGKTIYKLKINNLNGEIEPARLYVDGEIKIGSIFSYLEEDIIVNFHIKSRNDRVD